MPECEVRSFSEPYEFAAAFQNSGVELSPSTVGPFTGHITRVRLHSLHMQRSSETLASVSYVTLRAGRSYVTFHTTPGVSAFRNGMELGQNDVGLLTGKEPYYRRTLGPVHMGSISLPAEEMHVAGITAIGRDLTLLPNPLMVTPSTDAMARFRRLHGSAGMLAAAAPEVVTHSEVARGLEQTLILAMVACFNTGDVHEDRSARRRHQAVMKRFGTLLEADPDRPWYMLEIARAIGVSLRSLSVCCQEHLGMGPKRYLLLRRMSLARQALIEADPLATTVTDIATRYGFWQFGRFSGEYKSMFGESPSITLRRAREARHANYLGDRSFEGVWKRQ